MAAGLHRKSVGISLFERKKKERKEKKRKEWMKEWIRLFRVTASQQRTKKQAEKKQSLAGQS